MLETLGHDADDCVRLIVEEDVLADHVWIAAEALLPGRVTDHRDSSSSRLIVLRIEIAAQYWSDSHHFEVIRRDHARVNALGFVVAGDVYEPAAERRHRLKHLVARAPVEKVRIRN